MLEVGNKAPEFSKETPNNMSMNKTILGEVIC